MSTSQDPWSSWKTLTQARIALGRAGGSLPTSQWLTFNFAHSLARDAVHASLDAELLASELAQLGLPTVVTTSNARDRFEYLRRPDLGRQLPKEEARRIGPLLRSDLSTEPQYDLVIIVADGLSSPAAQAHSVPLLKGLVPLLQAARWKIAPIVIARQARVALQDEIGALAKARISLILLGERPGLSSPDSLGAYFIYEPQTGSNDAQRNCISNIRPDGLPIQQATETLYYLLTQSHTRRLSGVQLKDDRVLGLPGAPTEQTHRHIEINEAARISPQ